ncbi:hypothetical protein ACE2AJ_13140 [Aquihabitans daechungensis]|uniref:hypothetical protein n=1 Tax=Aquihabitans daechungensis TaxID=1052257 RepID=UPI003BA24584
MTDPAAESVITPPGLPILDAAAWVGRACWAELRLHAVLTHWLSVEVDPGATTLLWTERADAADRAEAWHHRLPELREYPRSAFIAASSDGVARLFDRLADLDEPAATEERRGALSAVLRGLRLGYHAHLDRAVGPADGPTATALNAALRSTFGVGGAEPDPAWTAAVSGAGSLP